MRRIIAPLTPTLALLAACSTNGPAVSSTAGDDGASGVTPVGVVAPGAGVPVGSAVGDATVYDADGAPVKLASLHRDRPIVVTFYRGDWCPFCNRALANWQDRLPEVAAEGAAFVALTPEKPGAAAGVVEKHGLQYQVYSDATRDAARALNVNFSLAPSIQKTYKGYGIDLAESNADGQWALPHPGTFVIDRDGVVRYAHVSEDYQRGRADPDEVIAALRAL